MTERDEDAELTERRLCATCIGEAYLRREVDRQGDRNRCDYCSETGSTLSIGEIAITLMRRSSNITSSLLLNRRHSNTR